MYIEIEAMLHLTTTVKQMERVYICGCRVHEHSQQGTLGFCGLLIPLKIHIQSVLYYDTVRSPSFVSSNEWNPQPLGHQTLVSARCATLLASSYY